jgi:hypothetical protein
LGVTHGLVPLAPRGPLADPHKYMKAQMNTSLGSSTRRSMLFPRATSWNSVSPEASVNLQPTPK